MIVEVFFFSSLPMDIRFRSNYVNCCMLWLYFILFFYFLFPIIFPSCVFLENVTMDPSPIHRPMRLAIENKINREKMVFKFWKIRPWWGTLLFGVATYFLFLFLKWRKLSKNKNPSMTLVKKKHFAKLDFWVRGSGYLLERYLMQGSTLLSSEFALY